MLGINSFLKGCSKFGVTGPDFYNPGGYSRRRNGTSLDQFSFNPSVYSRLSCFLPWIAEQYGLTYTPSQPTEPECEEGVGNINEVTAEVCRATTDHELDVQMELEPPCILPFILNNEIHNECTLVQINDFTRPQFICPIRTLRGRGTNYTTADSDNTFCPTHFDSSLHPEFTSDPVLGPNNQWELDPNNENCIDEDKKFAFATCKNTCPGGETRDSLNVLNIS